MWSSSGVRRHRFWIAYEGDAVYVIVGLGKKGRDVCRSSGVKIRA